VSQWIGYTLSDGVVIVQEIHKILVMTAVQSTKFVQDVGDFHGARRCGRLHTTWSHETSWAEVGYHRKRALPSALHCGPHAPRILLTWWNLTNLGESVNIHSIIKRYLSFFRGV
jgi:hypothetical protein